MSASCITNSCALSRISLVRLSVFSPAAASCAQLRSSGAKVSWMHMPICCSQRLR